VGAIRVRVLRVAESWWGDHSLVMSTRL